MNGRKSILPEDTTTVQLASLVGLSTRSIREWASRGVMVRGVKDTKEFGVLSDD